MPRLPNYLPTGNYPLPYGLQPWDRGVNGLEQLGSLAVMSGVLLFMYVIRDSRWPK